jgi:hypothetical protein
MIPLLTLFVRIDYGMWQAQLGKNRGPTAEDCEMKSIVSCTTSIMKDPDRNTIRTIITSGDHGKEGERRTQPQQSD